jgi:GAF domain-containing protein
VPDDRLLRILRQLKPHSDQSEAARLCEVGAHVVEMTGAGIMLMSGDIPRGFVCSSDDVSTAIEDLQFTLGEGPCVDAFNTEQPVIEPDLANPTVPRWISFSPSALAAGARAVFGFPLRVGSVRIGALNLYRDQPGGLTDDQHANALVMADVASHAVLDMQANAPPGAFAAERERGSDFRFVVHQASGMASVQLGVSVAEALIRLRAFAFARSQPLTEVAEDIVARRLRLD